MYISIEKNTDGSHAFQIGGALPENWAYWDTNKVPVPDSFPYVDVQVSGFEVVAASERAIPEETKELTWQDVIEAQVTYTAMMTDTLLEV